MAKKRTNKRTNKKKEVVDKRGLCPSCLKNGKQVKMTPRGDAMACSNCNCWVPTLQANLETKEEKITRLKAELAALE